MMALPLVSTPSPRYAGTRFLFFLRADAGEEMEMGGSARSLPLPFPEGEALFPLKTNSGASQIEARDTSRGGCVGGVGEADIGSYPAFVVPFGSEGTATWSMKTRARLLVGGGVNSGSIQSDGEESLMVIRIGSSTFSSLKVRSMTSGCSFAGTAFFDDPLIIRGLFSQFMVRDDDASGAHIERLYGGMSCKITSS